MDSILDNKLNKEEYEVIICDDKSTDNFLSIVKTYEDKMNIIYCTTTREVHCPGNTRQADTSKRAFFGFSRSVRFGIT